MNRVALAVWLALLAGLPAAGSAQWLELSVPERPAMDSASAEVGRVIYEAHCWYCHGDEGDGRGPVAEHLWPRPRDFTIASFKFRTTTSGELPTDEDLFRTVTLGLPGTAMPEWRSVLTAEERWQVISYIKTFAGGLFEDEAFDPYQAVVALADPSDSGSESLIATGREVYEQSDCWECHGMAGRGDGQKAPELRDDWGFPDRATDLETGWRFRGGSTPREIALRLSTGLDGTPMPSYAETLTEEERWEVAHYVASLGLETGGGRPPPAVLSARRADGDLPVRPDDDGWATAEEVWIPLSGQATFAPRWQVPAVSDLAVRALYSASEIALRLSWNDPYADTIPADPARANAEGWTADDSWPALFPDGQRRRGVYPDAVEVMLPAQPLDGPALPHLVYGDVRRPVELWRWSADRQVSGAGSAVRELDARGSERPPEPRAPAAQRADGSGTFADGRWSVVIRRPLSSSDDATGTRIRPGELIPIAFHVWDGSNGETGLRMALSSWYFLHLRKPARPAGFLLVLAAILATIALEYLAVRSMRRRAGQGRLALYVPEISTRQAVRS